MERPSQLPGSSVWLTHTINHIQLNDLTPAAVQDVTVRKVTGCVSIETNNHK